MLKRILGLGDGRDFIGNSISIVKRAMFILTIATSIFCVLTIISAQTEKCAGQPMLLGAPSGISDFLAPAIMSLLTAIMLGIVVTPERTKRALMRGGFPIELNSSLPIPPGMILTAFFGGLLLAFGVLTWISVERYKQVASFCYSAASIFSGWAS